MKITITQVEIEEAIRNHIHNMVAVKPGHTITMDFSATRGADGLTAFIDIQPNTPGDGPTEQPATATPAPAAQAPEAPQARQRITRPRAVQTEPAAAAATAPEEAPAADQEQDGEPATEGSETEAASSSKSIFGSAAASSETIAEAEPDGVEEVEGATPMKRSIFSGLTRPSNQTEASADAA